jgi:predicted nucleic acid-binding protein
MRYVIDSSVAFKWVVPEIDSDKATRLRDDCNNAVHDLLSPDIFPTEIGNALAFAERASRIQPGEAALFFVEILTNTPRLYSAVPLLPRAMDICIQKRQSVYDCLYVALAEQEGCDFITADTKMVNALQKDFPFIRALATMP